MIGTACHSGKTDFLCTLSWDRENYIFPKVTKMGSIIWPQNRQKWCRCSERPVEHTQQKLTQIPPPASPPSAPPWFKMDSSSLDKIYAIKWLLFATQMRTSMVAKASTKVTTISSRNKLPLPSSKWTALHFLVSRMNTQNFFAWSPPEKARDIAFTPSVMAGIVNRSYPESNNEYIVLGPRAEAELNNILYLLKSQRSDVKKVVIPEGF